MDYALVIDDHPLVARGIADYLMSHCGFTRAHAATTSPEAQHLVTTLGDPRLAVIDFWLSDGESLPLLSTMAQNCPATRLLVISGDDDSRVGNLAKEAGAHGYLNKHAEPEIFSRAVATLMSGAQWLPGPGDVPLPPQRRDIPVEPGELGLTQRQGEVLSMILLGLPNKRIAKELDISEPTVKEHVTNILTRLGVTSRVEAITLLRGRRIKL